MDEKKVREAAFTFGKVLQDELDGNFLSVDAKKVEEGIETILNALCRKDTEPRFYEDKEVGDLMSGLLEDTNKAVDEAAKWMVENPDFEPRFSRVCNVVLNDDVGTKEMTIEVLKRAGVPNRSLSFSMPHYASEVMKAWNTRADSPKEKL